MPGLDDEDDVPEVEEEESKPKRKRSWPPFTGIAVGVMIGGLFSAVAVWVTLHQETQRTKDAETHAATGTARVMISQLDGAVVRLCAVGRARSFAGSTPQLQPPVKLADRELVAANVSADQWEQFAIADQALGALEEQWPVLRARAQGRAFRARRAGLIAVVTKTMDGRAALGPLAGYPKGSKQWVCNTKRWKSKYQAP